LELRAEGLSCGIWLHNEPEDLMDRINQVLNIEMP
jgi:flagellar biosynthesis regulator FlaF